MKILVHPEEVEVLADPNIDPQFPWPPWRLCASTKQNQETIGYCEAFTGKKEPTAEQLEAFRVRAADWIQDHINNRERDVGDDKKLKCTDGERGNRKTTDCGNPHGTGL